MEYVVCWSVSFVLGFIVIATIVVLALAARTFLGDSNDDGPEPYQM